MPRLELARGSQRRAAHRYGADLITLALDGFAAAPPDHTRQAAAELQVVQAETAARLARAELWRYLPAPRLSLSL